LFFSQKYQSQTSAFQKCICLASCILLSHYVFQLGQNPVVTGSVEGLIWWRLHILNLNGAFSSAR